MRLAAEQASAVAGTLKDTSDPVLIRWRDALDTFAAQMTELRGTLLGIERPPARGLPVTPKMRLRMQEWFESAADRIGDERLTAGIEPAKVRGPQQGQQRARAERLRNRADELAGLEQHQAWDVLRTQANDADRAAAKLEQTGDAALQPYAGALRDLARGLRELRIELFHTTALGGDLGAVPDPLAQALGRTPTALVTGLDFDPDPPVAAKQAALDRLRRQMQAGRRWGWVKPKKARFLDLSTEDERQVAVDLATLVGDVNRANSFADVGEGDCFACVGAAEGRFHDDLEVRASPDNDVAAVAKTVGRPADQLNLRDQAAYLRQRYGAGKAIPTPTWDRVLDELGRRGSGTRAALDVRLRESTKPHVIYLVKVRGVVYPLDMSLTTAELPISPLRPERVMKELYDPVGLVVLHDPGAKGGGPPAGGGGDTLEPGDSISTPGAAGAPAAGQPVGTSVATTPGPGAVVPTADPTPPAGVPAPQPTARGPPAESAGLGADVASGTATLTRPGPVLTHGWTRYGQVDLWGSRQGWVNPTQLEADIKRLVKGVDPANGTKGNCMSCTVEGTGRLIGTGRAKAVNGWSADVLAAYGANGWDDAVMRRLGVMPLAATTQDRALAEVLAGGKGTVGLLEARYDWVADGVEGLHDNHGVWSVPKKDTKYDRGHVLLLVNVDGRRVAIVDFQGGLGIRPRTALDKYRPDSFKLAVVRGWGAAGLPATDPADPGYDQALARKLLGQIDAGLRPVRDKLKVYGYRSPDSYRLAQVDAAVQTFTGRRPELLPVTADYSWAALEAKYQASTITFSGSDPGGSEQALALMRGQPAGVPAIVRLTYPGTASGGGQVRRC